MGEKWGFQMCCCDLPILSTLLQEAGKALWKHLLTIVLCFFANAPFGLPFYKGYILHLHYESSCKYIT